MTARTLTLLIISLAALTALAGCGNKGDLYLKNDPISELDMEQFQQSLDAEEVPVAAPVEVNDESVYVKPGKSSKKTSASDADSVAVPVD